MGPPNTPGDRNGAARAWFSALVFLGSSGFNCKWKGSKSDRARPQASSSRAIHMLHHDSGERTKGARCFSDALPPSRSHPRVAGDKTVFWLWARERLPTGSVEVRDSDRKPPKEPLHRLFSRGKGVAFWAAGADGGCLGAVSALPGVLASSPGGAQRHYARDVCSSLRRERKRLLSAQA